MSSHRPKKLREAYPADITITFYSTENLAEMVGSLEFVWPAQNLPDQCQVPQQVVLKLFTRSKLLDQNFLQEFFQVWYLLNILPRYKLSNKKTYWCNKRLIKLSASTWPQLPVTEKDVANEIHWILCPTFNKDFKKVIHT